LERSSQVSLLRPAKLELSSSPILLWLKEVRKGGNNKPLVRVQYRYNNDNNDVVPVIITNTRLRLVNRDFSVLDNNKKKIEHIL
jgi:hypothetical protein